MIDVYVESAMKLGREKIGTSPLAGKEIHDIGYQVRFSHRGAVVEGRRSGGFIFPLALRDIQQLYIDCKIDIPFGHDFFSCRCGNTADVDGFYPVNKKSIEVEPDSPDWDGCTYVCADCGDHHVYDVTADENVPETRLIIHDLDSGRIYEVKSYEMIEKKHRKAANQAIDKEDTVTIGKITAQIIHDFMW